MKRRSKAGGKPRRGKAAARTRRNAPKSMRRSSAGGAETERFKRELHEALEQQAATAEVLKVISSSPGKLEPVFKTILENATRICEAKLGAMALYEDGGCRIVALNNAPPAYADQIARDPFFHTHPEHPLSRVFETKQIVRVSDAAAQTEHARGRLADLAGARTLLAVPMLKDNELLGAIAIYRQVVLPFTDKQIELVQNFASQAVIAIENVRLLNELRDSLEQQTATADVLKVISRSAFDLKVVLDTLLRSAGRLCEADMGVIARRQDDQFYRTVAYGLPDDLRNIIEDQPVELSRNSGSGRALLEGKVIHIHDIEADPEYTHASRGTGAFRALLGVPMLRDGTPVGVMTLMRKSVDPFTDKQIELVSTFADQAAIAIENVRLFEAEQQRTTELTEALEQQTATSEVLSIISSSPGELEPVFDAMLANAVRICGAQFGNLALFDGGELRLAAMHNAPHALAELRRRDPVIDLKRSIAGPVVKTKQVNHVRDLAAQEPYAESALAKVGGARTALSVPMLREDTLVGTINIYHLDVRPFTDKQIEFLHNFAAQAVIAIESTRLLNELRQSLEQQTATSEVLRVISSSPGELEPVFRSILKNATGICQAQFGTLNLYDGETYHTVALHNPPPQFAQRLGVTIRPHPESGLAHVARTKEVAHIDDLRTQPPYLDGDKAVVDLVDLGGARTLLIVPMIKDGKLVGAISIYRQEVRPFGDRQVELVKSFAAQAVIAIENTRLLNELRERTSDLTKSWNSKPRLLRCSKSSAARRRMHSRFLMRFVKVRRECARRCSALFGGTMATSFTTRRATISRPKSSITFSRHIPSGLTGRWLLDGRYWTAG